MKTRFVVSGMMILLVLWLVSACSGDDPTNPKEDPDLLLTVEFDNYNMFDQPREGFVFVSDEDGLVLDCAPWTGTSTVNLKNTQFHPEVVTFTIFEVWGTMSVFITELEVPVGSVRNFPVAAFPTQSGSVSINFDNVPETQRYAMSTNYMVSGSQTQIPSAINLGVTGDVTDFYVMAVPEVGTPVGGWLRGLNIGESDTLDFDSPGDVAPLDAARIEVSAGASWGFLKARAYVGREPQDRLRLMDYIALTSDDPDTLSLYLPQLESQDLVFELYQEFEGEIETFFWQEIQGQLPSAMTNLEGKLDVLAALPDSLVFEVGFPWDRFSSHWRQAHDDLAVWSMKGPASTEGLGLPEIPVEIAEVIPEFPREGFSLFAIEAYQETGEGVVRSHGKYFPHADRFETDEPMKPGLHCGR